MTSKSIAPTQWIGLSVRITCASCKIVVQEMSAPRCVNLITTGGLEATQAPGMEGHARSNQWTGRQSGRPVASLPFAPQVSEQTTATGDKCVSHQIL